MNYIADLHIHSRFSRATSKNITLDSLTEGAKRKGISLITTGDILHPVWRSEIKSLVKEKDYGIYSYNGVDIMLGVEVSSIFKDKGRVRKIHTVLLIPDFRTALSISNALSERWNMSSDGRPIIGMNIRDFIRLIVDINPDTIIIPAHIWTPWFSIFGSNSGYNSIEECCEDMSRYIDALETGLSSDPPMNWMVSDIDKYTLVSNSDAHSVKNLGREANVFSRPLNIKEMKHVLRQRDSKRFLFTIEFFPQEGKYHYDGHRNCNISLSPGQSIENKNICPVCGRPLTLGVLHRVYELADRKMGEKPLHYIPFKSLIPLREIISNAIGVGPDSKKVSDIHTSLISHFNNEFYILLYADKYDIARIVGEEIASKIDAVRKGRVHIKPGYDGVYGKIEIDTGIVGKEQTLF